MNEVAIMEINFSVMAIFIPKREEVHKLKIKKVDDKPMVIHTKQKAKIHMHEPKQASIKGSNIYTVDRDPTKKSTGKGNYRKGAMKGTVIGMIVAIR